MWRRMFIAATDIGMRFLRYDVLIMTVAIYLVLLAFIPLGLIFMSSSSAGGELLATALERIFPEGFSYSSEDLSDLRIVVNAALFLSFVVATIRSVRGAKPSVRVPTRLFAILSGCSASSVVILSIVARDPMILLALIILVPASILFWTYVALGWVHEAIRTAIMNAEIHIITPPQSR